MQARESAPGGRSVLVLIDKRQVGWLAALSAASALTEGLGLMPLVPMLAALRQDSAGGGYLGPPIQRCGWNTDGLLRAASGKSLALGGRARWNGLA